MGTNGKLKPGLRSRADQGKWWWELRACAYYPEFEQPKIIFNRFINAPTFAYDALGYYHNDACYCAVTPDRALVAVVASQVGWFVLSHLCTPLQNGYLQVFIQFLARLPVPDLDVVGEELRSVVASGGSAAEAEVESLVRAAYGLTTADERALSEWFTRRSLASDTNEGAGDED